METTTTIHQIVETVTTTVHQWSLPDNSDNIIHQLFYSLGCNFDAQPETWKEAFMIGLQFFGALWFIGWLVKLVYTLMRGALGGGR